MFPGMGRINPQQMSRMMKQLGIKSEELPVKRVVFELENKRLVIENPSVTAIDLKGMKTFQVIGEAREEKEAGVPEEDVKMVAEQAGVSRENAKKALEKSKGDIAEAITRLKS